MNVKIQQLAGIIALVGITVGGLSVSGIMQFTETLDSSGIVIVPDPAPPPAPPPNPPPPEPEIVVDVYSDSGCTNSISNIVWGTIDAGSQSDVTVYIRNEGEASVVLSLSSNNWDPQNAESYMTLSWDYSGQTINPNQVRQIILTLDVDPSCPPLSDFDFQVLIIAS